MGIFPDIMPKRWAGQIYADGEDVIVEFMMYEGMPPMVVPMKGPEFIRFLKIHQSKTDGNTLNK